MTVLILLSMLGLAGCNSGEDRGSSASSSYNTIDWLDLIPKSDLDALMNPPDYLSSIVDGSAEDQIDSTIFTNLDSAPESAYEKALVSSNVVSRFNQQKVRLPGFIVPLEFDEDLILTKFFLVPYFGACLHTPPPPPNQIVYVEHEQGLPLDSIEKPYWVAGKLTTESAINDMAHAAYTITASSVSLYEESQENP